MREDEQELLEDKMNKFTDEMNNLIKKHNLPIHVIAAIIGSELANMLVISKESPSDIFAILGSFSDSFAKTQRDILKKRRIKINSVDLTYDDGEDWP